MPIGSERRKDSRIDRQPNRSPRWYLRLSQVPRSNVIVLAVLVTVPNKSYDASFNDNLASETSKADN